MPHYVTKPTQRSLKYYIFSTIVMAPITKKMYRAEMEQWLKDNGYDGDGGPLDPRPYAEVPEIVQHYDTPGLRKLLDEQQEKTYWNGSFWFVTEEDGYFV